MCIAEGRLLSDVPYRVVRSQKLGVTDFFCASSSSSSASVSSLQASGDECADIGDIAKQDDQNGRRRLPTLGSLIGQSGRGDHEKADSREGKGNKREDNGIRTGKGIDVASRASTAVNRDADFVARRGSYRGVDGHGHGQGHGGKEGENVIDLSCLGSSGPTKVTDHVWPKCYEASLSSEGKGGKRSRDDTRHGSPRRTRKIATSSSSLTLNCT